MAFMDDLKAQASKAIDQAYLQGIADGVAKAAAPLKQAGQDALTQLSAIQAQISAVVEDSPTSPPSPKPDLVNQVSAESAISAALLDKGL